MPNQRTALAYLLCAALAVSLHAQAQAPASTQNVIESRGGVLRLGFTSTVFDGVNAADARAAIRSLTRALAGELNVPADPDPLVSDGLDEAVGAYERNLVDALGMTVEEYAVLSQRVNLGRLVTPIYDGEASDTYVVVARTEEGLKQLSDLSGKRLVVLSGMRMALGEIWLDVALTKAGLPDVEHFFGGRSTTAKPAKALLPVFFRQVDACLVTRRAYDIAVELNPQLGRTLTIIATSPAYVPITLAFRSDETQERIDRWIGIFTSLHRTPAGLQALTIFHSRQVAETQPSAIAPALALVEEHTRLCPQAAATRLAALYAAKRRGAEKP